MSAYYSRFCSEGVCYFSLKQPDEQVVDLWLEDMSRLAAAAQNFAGSGIALVLIEYDGRYSQVSPGHVIDRVLEWLENTPRCVPARVCVLTTESILSSWIECMLRLFSGRDTIRIFNIDQTDEAHAWLMAHRAVQSSK